LWPAVYDPAALSVAVIDIGTNSTRLLVADVVADGSGLIELEREARVTRLGRGVDTSGQLAPDAIEDVCAAVSDWLDLAAPHQPDHIVALATSAVRDASNGDALLAELRERFALDARVIDGLLEARLTYRGATCGRDPGPATLVFDIGGGSTELVVGDGSEFSFHESLELGVVRHSERFLPSDPPAASELEALADSLASELTACRGRYGGPTPAHAIAVAGTPTSLAGIELELVPYDATSVEGHLLELSRLPNHLSRLASLPLAERREVKALHPDRAATIVCGVVILISTMRAFGLGKVEVSEQDILWGAALAAADPDEAL
jgi:exopolyphosphatase/guanosine-5'-triphosphate,3'-diphosphate pyrophosphatase